MTASTIVNGRHLILKRLARLKAILFGFIATVRSMVATICIPKFAEQKNMQNLGIKVFKEV